MPSLNGVWTLNPKMSDSLDPILRLPGMNASLRKVLKLNSFEVNLVLVYNDNGTSLISNAGSDNDSESNSSGDKVLPSQLPPIWEINDFGHSCDKKLILGQHTYDIWDPHFGLLTCSARWKNTRQVKDRFLRAGVGDRALVVEEVVESMDMALFFRAVWTFGKGRHTRRVEITAPGATVRRQLVYDSHFGNDIE